MSTRSDYPGAVATGIVVKKYGGSSLSTLDRVRRVAQLVAESHRAGHPTVVVVSARGDTTDELIRLGSEMSAQARSAKTARELDQLLATGECASTALLALALHGIGVPAVSLTGPQAGVLADGRYGAGVISAVATSRIAKLLAEGSVVVVAGFQGLNPDGDLITLGRGGSDTTAVALATELRADRCEIYTDVGGVYTADPRVLPSARLLPEVDPSVMAEMAFAGAKVLHSRAIELAAMWRVPLHVGSSFTNRLGTLVPGGSDEDMLETRGVVVAIAHDLDVARMLVYSSRGRTDLAAQLLGVLARHSVPVDLVARSGPYEDEFRMGFTIRRSDVDEVLVPLQRVVAEYGDVRVDRDVGKVSLVGMGLLNRPEYTARMLGTLAWAGIPTSWVSTSQLRTSAVVPLDQVTAAVEALHREFSLEYEGVAHEDAGVGSMAPA